MGDAMPLKNRKVILMQKMFVTDFNAIGPTLGKLAQEPIQGGREIATEFIIADVKPGEFKKQDPDFFPEWFTRLEKLGSEQVCVKKILIHFAGSQSEAWQVTEFLDRDLIGHF